jgi:hypothetical protein
MRFLVLVLVSIAAWHAGGALAQIVPAARENTGASPQEAPEEVIVRGRRIGELRFEVDLARQRAFDIFNEINNNDDFDVSCRNENASGTRMRRQVCRARFENRTSAEAASEYLSVLKVRCSGLAEEAQACMFSDMSSGAISAAQGVETEALHKRDVMNEEILRLANENEEFARAILDYYDLHQRYEAERKRRREE